MSIGSQTLHTEFRVRTLCELVLNEEFYLQPSIVSLLSPDGHEISKNALIGTSANYYEAQNRVHTCMENDAARTIFRLDCLDTAMNGTFSNMWHLHALTSVLKRSVTSIYPEKNSRIRPLLHRVIHPRVLDHTLQLVSVPLLILWTSTCIPLHSTTWSPNHFVPCFSKVDQCQNISMSIASSPHDHSSTTNVNYNSSNPDQSFTPIPVVSYHDSQIVSSKSPPLQTSKECTVISSINYTQEKSQPVSCTMGSQMSVTFTSLTQPCFNKGSSQLTNTAPTPSNESSTLKCQIRLDQTSALNSNLPTDRDQKAKVDTINPSIMLRALANINTNNDQNKHRQALSDKSSCICTFFQVKNHCTLGTHSTHEIQKPTPSNDEDNRSNKASQNRCTQDDHSNPKGNEMVVSDPLKPQVIATETIISAVSILHAPKATSNEARQSTNTIKNYFSPVTVITPENSGTEPDPDNFSIQSSSDDEYMEYHLYLSDTDSDDATSIADSAMETETMPKVVINAQHCIPSLPFPLLSCAWYKHQHDLAINNAARTRSRYSNETQTDMEGNIVSVNRCPMEETLEQSIQRLRDNIETIADSSLKKHQLALVKVGEFILAKGPVVKTREAGNVYIREKGLKENNYSTIELYEILCKHLSVSQVYIFNQAYLVQNTPGSNLNAVVSSLNQIIDKSVVVNDITKQRLQDLLLPSLRYMDTPRDKLVLKGIMAELTDNNTLISNLLGLKSRKGVTSARVKLHQHLSRYQQICLTSQVVRSDLTAQQQYRLTQRIISRRKLNEIKVISEGRGRKLKSAEFPELAAILTFAFGEYDIIEGGGGLQSHPRLTTGTMYKSSDNCLTMKRAREILLSCAPENFKISLSACYNYTENYREGSRQARQHHAGQGVNALLSLRKSPRTGVDHLVVNLHWTSANVNLLIDESHGIPQSLVISKDAKAIVPGDISPVQIQGHTWKKRLVLPDHSWDQSRVNAITPMTFLFVETVITKHPTSTVDLLELPVSESTILHLKRTGQGVTLLSLSFFEAETTFKCLNEILYLLSLSALDPFFRDLSTGQLKTDFIFIVDNGPSEQPNSPLVQMSLIRLMNLLKLRKIAQVSYAEYNSKRNFVERVHAEENRVLSKHSPFSSKAVHEQAVPGSKEHHENMEHMAEAVRNCISQGSFGSKPLLAFRNIKPSDYIFTDEQDLQKFLDISEEGKQEFLPNGYSATQGKLLDTLHFVWGAERNFTGRYIDDYKAINNNLIDSRTSWLDKYTSCFYTSNDTDVRRFELQPIPDYLRWMKTGELHYLSLEERALLLGPWDDIPGAQLPSKIMELCFAVIPQPEDDIINQVSLLAWITPQEVRAFYKKIHDQFDGQLKDELERRSWKTHPLYKKNTKTQLESMCRGMKIPVTTSLLKHQLVRLISEVNGEQPRHHFPHHQLYIGETFHLYQRLLKESIV